MISTKIPGRVAQSVTCLTADMCLTGDLAEIDHEIISTAILLPSADPRRVVVSYKRNYVHKLLVKHLVNLVQEKSVFR